MQSEHSRDIPSGELSSELKAIRIEMDGTEMPEGPFEKDSSPIQR
jgi:hypothetical protein